MKGMNDKGVGPAVPASALETGFVALGSPHKYPQNDPSKPERPPLTSRDSRLHSDSSGMGGCCMVIGLEGVDF